MLKIRFSDTISHPGWCAYLEMFNTILKECSMQYGSKIAILHGAILQDFSERTVVFIELHKHHPRTHRTLVEVDTTQIGFIFLQAAAKQPRFFNNIKLSFG